MSVAGCRPWANLFPPIPNFHARTPCLIAPDVKLGRDVIIYNFVNLYGCEIGDGTKIGSFVEIQKGAFVGRNCKVSSHTFICEGVTIEDEVFIGHGVIFINDKYPRDHPRRLVAVRG